MILADDKRLRQILLNLLSNAVKFTEKGKVVFSVQRLNNNEQKAKLRFEVNDTGFGIRKDQLDSIFIPFHQLDNAITRAEGSGLGLTISQRLVNLMGSKLNVKSKVEQRSQFWFDLEISVLMEDSYQLEEFQDEFKDLNEQKEVVFPRDDLLVQLIEHAKRHNVLGVRSVILQLEQDTAMEPFLQQIKPFVENYRFRQLIDWIEQNAV